MRPERVIAASLLALVFTGALFFFVRLWVSPGAGESVNFLEIRDSSSGKVYGQWKLEGGEFAIEFIHSVNQRPVRETFRIENHLIRPVAVRFSSFGAGMQSDLDEGQKLGRDGEYLVISGYKASYKELNYIVGTVSDHLLFINDSVVSLSKLCGRNAHITIKGR